jgi:long-chain acyl-CoA synthetase
VASVAEWLDRAEVKPGDRVALMAENGPHWPTVDFAALCLGAVPVPVYPTLAADEAGYVLRDCGAKVLFVQGRKRWEQLAPLRDQLPELERVVLIDAEGHEDEATPLHELVEGGDWNLERLGERAATVKPEQLATLIYTSGTTGEPKGVMLTHDNLVANLTAILQVFPFDEGDTALSFLPLSHSLERTVDYVYFATGATIAYVASVHEVASSLLDVRPQVFVSVPRVYEKLRARIDEALLEAPPWRRWLFDWAVRQGRRTLPAIVEGPEPRGVPALRLAAARLVLGRIRRRLGGRFRMAVSGGAPLAKELAELFWIAGVPIYEGYGLTETSPVVATNTPAAARLGTVGRPLPGVEVRIAADGEILVRGPNVMQGYFGDPRSTAEVLDGDGWLYTGDVGELDADGFLVITDRKKELIVTAYGKNVAPAPIEIALKASPFVEQAVVLGDRRKFLAALIVPAFDLLENWARDAGLETGDRRRLLAEPKVRERLDREVEEVNRRHSRYQQVKAWNLLPEELTLERGELTPTQKVKRRVVEERYADVIEALYAE